MGNRMLCALTALLYARATHRQLMVDWRDPQYSDGTCNAFHRFFRCPDSPPLDVLPASGSVFPAIWQGHLDLCAAELIAMHSRADLASFRAVRKYSADVRRTDYTEDILIVWSYLDQINLVKRHLNGELAGWRRWTREAILRKLLRECLLPQPEIQARIEAFAALHWPGQTVIGVHVRFTDMKIPLRRYWAPIDRLIASHANGVIFLATDSREVLRQFGQRYGPVICTPKDLPSDGRALHSGHGERDKIAHGIEALVDMYLLARCHCLVYSGRSTFSYISHLLSDAPHGNVIDIERHNLVLHAKRFLQGCI